MCECVGGADAGRAGGDHPRSDPRVDSPSRLGTTVHKNIKLKESTITLLNNLVVYYSGFSSVTSDTKLVEARINVS